MVCWGMTTRVADMRTLPNASTAGVVPATLRWGVFFHAVADAAVAHPAPRAFSSSVRCIVQIAGEICRSPIQVITHGDVIRWWCDGCGEEGEIHGFRETHAGICVGASTNCASTTQPSRPRKARPRAKQKKPHRSPVRLWKLDEKAHATLLAAAQHAPEVRAVIARATPDDRPGTLLLVATVKELDAIYDLADELADRTQDPRECNRLIALRLGLLASIESL